MKKAELKKETVEELERICSRYPDRPSALLPALRLLERDFGEVNERGMLAVADLLGVSPAHVFGVFTFYTHFRRPGEGKYLVQVCSTLPCALRGSESVFDRLSEHLGVGNNETTPDGMFTLKKVECLANCDHGPCLQINEHYVDNATPDSAVALVEKLREGGEVEPQKYDLPENKYEPVLLRHVLEKDSDTLEHYLKRGGYEAAKKAVSGMKPAELIDLVKASGLRGRGGAGFPAGVKWGFTAKGTGKPIYLICNADESEPGTFKDKILIDRDPHLLLDGIIIASWAIEAHHCYIYIRGEFGPGAKILQRAIDEAYEKGYLGKGIMGTGFDLDVTVHRGGGAYICGEETGLLSSLEGKRGYPKIKPPFPAVEGAWGSPSIVNNVETICCLPYIILQGAEGFRRFGTEKSTGTKIFSVSGHVERPGNYEVPLGITLRELIYDLAGGIPGGRKLKAVVPGGSSAKVLTADEVDVGLDFEALQTVDSMLGSGGVIVMDDSTCMVDAIWNLIRFYHHESCGQCTPCREGTGWLEKLIARIERGEGRPGDVDLIYELATNMCGRTVCVLSEAAAWPVQSYVTKFRKEFEEHIEQKGCPMRKKVGV